MIRVVAFHPDRRAESGSGHIARCAALSTAFERHGWRIGEFGTRADLVVIDHYGTDSAFERACRSWARAVAVIEDLEDRAHDCDLVLRLTAADTPLDPGFSAARATALARRGGPAKRVLVFMGSSDPDGLTAVARDAAAATGLAVDVVTGHGLTAAEMADRMVSADLAVGSAGVSAWERCCLGLPSVVVCVADNQRANARQLAEAEAALMVAPERIADALGRLAADAALRRDMARRAAALCDGRGAARLVERLERMVDACPASA